MALEVAQVAAVGMAEGAAVVRAEVAVLRVVRTVEMAAVAEAVVVEKICNRRRRSGTAFRWCVLHSEVYIHDG